MKKQAGFTLIELVMVIVVLGILAAVALPKFVDLSDDASTAVSTYNNAADDVNTKIGAACAKIQGGDCTVKSP